jgi:hypothetical protein
MAFVSKGMYIPWQSDDWHHPSDVENPFEVEVFTTPENLMIIAICQISNGSRE